jgi:hypothetical protein
MLRGIVPHRTVSGLMQELQGLANPVHAPPGVNTHDVGVEPPRYARTSGGGIEERPKMFGGRPVPWSAKQGSGLGRRALLRRFDAGIGHIRDRALRSRGPLAGQWHRIESDLRKMIEHGILPCDLHSQNWGIRKSNGEITMRDAGCTTVIEH